MNTITAKYPGKCYLTGLQITPGDKIYRVDVQKGGIVKSYWALVSAQENNTPLTTPEVTVKSSVNKKDLLKNILGYFASHFEDDCVETEVFDLTSQEVKTVWRFEHKFSPYLAEEKFQIYVDQNNAYIATGYRKNYGKVKLDCVVIENNKEKLEDAFIIDPEIYWEAIQMYC